MLKVCVLASGSEGNACFVSDGNTRILIDAGIPEATIRKKLQSIGEDVYALDRILITHEHGDHSRGIRGMVGRYQIPIHLSSGTCAKLAADLKGCNAIVHPFFPEQCFEVGDFSIFPVHVIHDAAQPVGYVLTNGDKRLGVFTDLGEVPKDLAEVISMCDFVLIESNHDIEALANSAYPKELKKRVSLNHLSNDQVVGLIAEHMPRSLQHLVLGHISKGNNDHCKAHAMAKRELERKSIPARLEVIPGGATSSVITV